MPASNENTPLLGQTRTDQIRNEDVDESAIDDEVDEPLNVMISEHGAPVASFGLSGGMDVFGTSFARRSSVLRIGDEVDVNAAKRRRASQVTRSQPPNTFERRQHRMSESALLRYQRRKSTARKLSVASIPHVEGIEEIEDERDVEAGTEVIYLYGVSAAQFRWIFVGMNLTWFVAFFDSTLMASSHPVITSYFNASNSAAWLSTAFLLTSTAFQPMFGRVADMYGRKWPFILAMAIFTIATALCGLAQSILQFILARALCGFGAGGAMALGAIIVSDLIPIHRRAAYLAILNVSLGVATSLGASLGGLLADTLGWRWEFGIQVPALVACLLIAGFNIPSNLGPCLASKEGSTFRQTLKEFDLVGTSFLTISVTSLMLALNLGGNVLPWSDPRVIAALVVFVVLGIATIVTEAYVTNPIMPLRFLTRIPSANVILSQFFGCMTMNTVLFNIPLYFQGTLLDTPTRSGIRLLIPFVVSTFASIGTGWVIQRTHQVLPSMITGAVFIVIGSIVLTFMPRSLPDSAYTWLISLSTLGQGINFPTYSIGLLSVTPVEDLAVAMGVLFLFRNLGNVLGVAISSLASQNALLHYLDRDVTGDGAAEVIEKVRESVEAIKNLPEKFQAQVISAYASSMKITFGQGIITAALTVILIIGIQLPRLNAAVIEKAKAAVSE